MKRTMTVLGFAAMAGMASTATADEFFWEWNVGDTGVSNNGGIIEYVKALYNEDTKRFVWDVTFSNQVTEGYTLAVSPGPNPKGTAGELALIYFDATGASPVVTAYGYNGHNSATSYFDGDPAPGTQAPDQIMTSLVDAPFVADAFVSDVGGKRRMRLVLDASGVQSHLPPPDWSGVSFDDEIGVWFHPYRNLSTGYDNDGYLNAWSGSDGWLDGRDFSTTPTPGSMALLGLGGLAAARRRRK